ncbi:hypothetical protein H8356DRAFT_1357552 [Neocallimastix lanati (nom. inval.)]|nr:hypothetical protein H8356DRAFT_1357552 [Neocallimastix sp. JGI-2020a]
MIRHGFSPSGERSDTNSVDNTNTEIITRNNGRGVTINEWENGFLNNEALVLFFFNGLHPKFQEEIEKMEEFPSNLNDTKCILFENNIKSNKQLRNNNGNKNFRKKHSSPHVNNNNNYNNNN